MELLAVLALSALLAGAVVVSLRGPYQAARLENAIERVALADRQMRDHARHYARPAQIMIHLDRQTIAGVELPSGDTTFPRFQVESGQSMDQLIVGERRIDCGETAIPVSSHGQTPTYVIRFQKPKGDHLWLVFCGATGQNIRIDDERGIEELQRLAATRRPDAD